MLEELKNSADNNETIAKLVAQFEMHHQQTDMFHEIEA